MSLVSFIPYETIRKFTPFIFLGGLGLLVLVLAIGSDANGAKRWIALGPLTIQPSEIMKFAVIVFCADYIDRFRSQITLKRQPGSFKKIVFPFILQAATGAVFAGVGALGSMLVAKIAGTSEEFLQDGTANPYFGVIEFLEGARAWLIIIGVVIIAYAALRAYKKRIITEAPDFTFGVLPFGLLIAVLAVLLILQPHMSGLIIITLIIVVMMVLGECSAKYILGATGIGGALMGLVLLILPHSRKRLEVWRDPFSYIREGGWQPAQSLYAIGNGGLWGVGLGQSRQKHLYLPEPMNDYIFAILCEEFGFIGALAVILLFVFFVYRGIVIAYWAPDRFSSLVVLGITAQVGIQALLNIMVVTNTLPSTGISLPFFSYGGTALWILLAEMGVVLSISRYSVIPKK